MNILMIEQIKTSKKITKSLEKTLLTAFSILPTLYMRRLYAITPKKHTIDFINERYSSIPYASPYDVVLIHYTSASAVKAYEIADRFKKKKIPVILCGLHASALPEEALMYADSVLLGRGEANWLTALRDIESKSLKNIYPVESYDSIPCIIPSTKVSLPGFMIIGAIEATRGCPFNCNFCPESNTPNGHIYFKRPLKEVINEIKEMKQKIIMFYDASLTIDPHYTKKLFKHMIPLKKKFFCNGNANVLSTDEELIYLSKKAGCIGWLIGFESISQQTINAVKKTTNTVNTYKRVVDLIHKHKMIVIGDFMFGFDTDTKDVFKTTVTTIKKLGIDVADFTINTPFPGTPVYKDLEKEKRIITKDWSKYTMYSVVYQPKQMSPEELLDGVFYMYHSFYSISEVIKRIVKGLSYGIYPFFSSANRNLISMIASKKIQH
jgi:radical SAM superfamily enzyme YgiQ (UPF0313 family)